MVQNNLLGILIDPANISMFQISAKIFSFGATNNKASAESINQISKMLSGKYSSEEMTLVKISSIRDQDSMNYPGILRSPPSTSPYQADFISQYLELSGTKILKLDRLKFLLTSKLLVLISFLSVAA